MRSDRHVFPKPRERIVAMLTKLGQRGYSVCEEPGEDRTEEIDPEKKK